MKKKIQRWVRKQIGCPGCAPRATAQRAYTGTSANCSVTYIPKRTA